MWARLTEHFSRYPAQGRVARLLLRYGFAVHDDNIWAGEVGLTDTAIARAANVDRRVVKATVETIQGNPDLYRVYSRLLPTCHLREAAPSLGWGALEIVPTDASKPGILSGVAHVIAEHGISIRQAIVDDPEFAEEPRLHVITEKPIPADVLPEVQGVDGVSEVILGPKREAVGTSEGERA